MAGPGDKIPVSHSGLSVSLPGFGERFTPLSKEQLERLAGDVHAVIHRYDGRERVRAMVGEWSAERDLDNPLLFPLPERDMSFSPSTVCSVL